MIAWKVFKEITGHLISYETHLGCVKKRKFLPPKLKIAWVPNEHAIFTIDYNYTLCQQAEKTKTCMCFVLLLYKYDDRALPYAAVQNIKKQQLFYNNNNNMKNSAINFFFRNNLSKFFKLGIKYYSIFVYQTLL